MAVLGALVGAVVPAADATPAPPSATEGPARPAAGPSGAFDVPVATPSDPYGPRPDGVPQLSLGQIVHYALQNPLVMAADAEIDAMQAQLRKAKFAWIPVVETETVLSPGVFIECEDVQLDNGTAERFDFQYCRSSNDIDVDVNTVRGYFQQLSRAGVRFQWSADMVIPITTFGKIRNLKRAAEAGVVLRKLQKMQVQQETTLRVQKAHTTLLLARESKAILLEAKDIVDVARRRVRADLGGDDDDWDADPDAGNPDRDPDDLYQVELSAIEVEQLMREALKIESLALSALWALGGAAAPPHFDIAQRQLHADGIDGGLADLGRYKTQAIQHRPEARMASAASSARRAQERVARANFLPDLGVVVRFAYAVSSSADDAMSQLYYQDNFNYSRISAALALRWKWDFHNKVFDLQAARATRRAAEHQEAGARLLLGRDVEQAYADLVEATHKLLTNREAVDLAWKLVVSAQQKDSVGGGDAEKLLRGLEKWYRRRFEYVEAVGQHNDALARLSRAVGTPLAAAPSL